MVDQRGMAGLPAVRGAGAGDLPDRPGDPGARPDLPGLRGRAAAGGAVVGHRPFYTPWSWLPRIVMQFTAGALACAAVRKLRPTDRARSERRVASLLLAGRRSSASCTVWTRIRYPTILDAGGLVDVLFVPLVMTLAIGVGTLPALLSTRLVVYLGHISFSLYMVHELVHTTWNWMVMQFGLRLGSDLAGKAVLLGLLAVAFTGAVVLYHFVEEPAPPMDARHDEPAPRLAARTPGHGKLHPIDGQREERTPWFLPRAG